MKKSVCTYLISIFVLFSSFFDGSDACWGNSGLDYVDMTRDYDLLVGSDLVVNCTLRNRNVTIANKVISSSDLIIEKYNDTQYASKFTRVVDERTVQLKIPKVTINDSGFYFCKIFQSKDITPLTACGTKVNVGYPPHRIKEFSCISRNFDNIKCTWNTEENNIITNYTITKKTFNTWNIYQMCPTDTVKPNSCEWSTETDPVFTVDSRDIYFMVEGKNTLGTSVEEFKVDVYSIVIPNPPENLEILDIRQQSATIRWKPPTMRNLVLQNFKLKYEIRQSKVSHEFSDVTVYEIENSTSFLLENLIPHVTYNVTLRCRSAYTKNDSIWSDFVSAVFQTQASELEYTKPPRLEIFNSTCYKISWDAPILPNGPIDFYEVMWHKEEDASDVSFKTVQISGANSVIIELKCSQLTGEGTTFLFQVRSVSKKNDKNIFGPYSESTQLKDCQIPKGFLARTVCFGTLLLAFCAVLFMVKIIYRISLSEKSETRQLRYKSNKLAAEQEIRETVILEEGKYTKLGRKPGGNKNDCTCILAIFTTQNNLSPDNNNSCADSDFLIPSSPYLNITEPSFEISHKDSTKAHCALNIPIKM